LASDQTTLTIPAEVSAREDIPHAPEHLPQSWATRAEKYPYIRARGPMEATLLASRCSVNIWGCPTDGRFSRELSPLLSALAAFPALCGAIAELMGLNSQLLNVPAVAVSLSPLKMLRWQDSFALSTASEKELVLAVPETGIRRIKPISLKPGEQKAKCCCYNP